MWDGLKKGKICIKQHDEYDCGAAALCAIAAWYGLYLPLSNVKKVCNCTKDGVTIKGILDGAKSLGLDTKALKSPQKDIDRLCELKGPFIAHLQKDDGLLHFVVVIKVHSQKVDIMDPALGERVSYPINRFRGEWSGYIILLTPGNGFHKGEYRVPFYKRVAELGKHHKKWLITPMILSFAIILAGTINSFILQRLIDITLPSGRRDELTAIALVLPVIIIAAAIMEQTRDIALLKGGLKIDKELVDKYIRKVFSIPAATFNQFMPGDLNSRIGDVYKIRVFISEGLVAVPLCCATLLAVSLIMVLTNCRLAMLTLLFFPLYAVICTVSVNVNRKFNRILALLNARFENSMLYGMDTLITVKHFGAEEAAIKKIGERYRSFQQELLKAGKFSTLINTAEGAIGATLLAATLTVGGFMVMGGKLTAGEIVAFYTLSSLFTAPLDGLARMAGLYSQASVSVERLYEIMEIESENRYGDSITDSRDIVFENITFAYPGREPLFERFSTKIKANSITAICGGNGSGKSTLVALLMRDIVPLKGEIFINGKNINSISLNSWRRYISIIPQRVFILNDTLLANIACGEESPDMKLVTDICVEAGLSELINRLPNGICTNIGGGVGLSGGEMQKISIARALYRNPQIYVFDEATSNMDGLSERSIMGLMTKLRKMGKCVIVISHNCRIKSIADELIDLG